MKSLFSQAREPVSSLTHAIGAVLWAGFALAFSVYGLIEQQVPAATLLATGIFLLSLIALYSASAIYHFANTTARRLIRLRKLDHAMIYVLIAGTYTPIASSYMNHRHALLFLLVIWSVAIVGIAQKLIWLNSPRWLSTSLYLLMGWALIFDFRAFSTIPSTPMTFIAIGGIFYSIGALCYLVKKPNLTPAWGSHEIFHLFVLAGSASHLVAILFRI